MKKILKKLIYQIKNTKLITKVFLIILLLVGGGLTANHFVQKEYMIKVAKEHQKEMDEQVRYGDKKLDFGMAVQSDDGGKHIYCYEYTCAEQLDDWTKDGN